MNQWGFLDIYVRLFGRIGVRVKQMAQMAMTMGSEPPEVGI